MARSKNLHYVTHQFNITQPNDDPQENWAEGVIQVDAELSRTLGRTIRNGNQFRLVGMGASLRGYSGSIDLDTGFAANACIHMIPTTRHSVKAWQGVYNLWRKQKSLKASAIGAGVRYDDFEIGWDSGNKLASTRNSTVRTTGMNDSTTEDVVMVGASVDGSQISLEGYYDNLSPQAGVSANPFGTTTKEPKWIHKFPDHLELSAPATFSSMVDTTSTPDSLGNGIAMGEINWLPADNHLSHLTGTLFYFVKGIPGDTGIQLAEQLKMTITLVYEGWSPLAARPSRRRKTSKGKKA